ncbi:hypothetical protein JRO89_XS07G0151000 [Xanthoceras sorbifolium]|uniref:Uncharacterized protein n=1 Tax=Xanthoceras sorbifolium TaxID=99658 RepID=A0ABQ8HTY1_9ROSI|nr:hypothetical protein JRO89_XS07G0151000 [Xanthoceras sorbifolium]
MGAEEEDEKRLNEKQRPNNIITQPQFLSWKRQKLFKSKSFALFKEGVSFLDYSSVMGLFDLLTEQYVHDNGQFLGTGSIQVLLNLHGDSVVISLTSRVYASKIANNEQDADASARKAEAARKRSEDIAAGTVKMNGRELFSHEPWVFDNTQY